MSTWTAADVPDQTGRTIIITGASGGLGLATAAVLARAGARLVLAVRSVPRGEAAAATLEGGAEVRHLDVSDLASVRRFAADWTGDIDVLVHNAGIMQVPLARTRDGFESQLATNYLGPFALTALLLPHVTDRVVSVTSQLHSAGRVHLDDLNGERRPYQALDAYRDSKLCLVMFALELQRRLAAGGRATRSVLAHPGIIPTGLARHAASGRVTYALRFLFNDTATGAESVLCAATGLVPGGAYVGPRGPGGLRGHPAVGAPARSALDELTAARLWDLTAGLTRTDPALPSAARPGTP